MIEINTKEEAQQAVNQLNIWTKLYDEGTPIVSDKEWDDLYFQVEEYEKRTGVKLQDSPTRIISFDIVNKLEKVTHNHPMLSLDKTKSEETVLSLLRNYDTIAMAKMDGLTCSIRYIDGKIASAETRGNGIVGEDITHNIKFVKNVPIEIPIKEELIVDGEVICTYEDFKDFGDTYKNPRNFASGSIRLLDSRESAKRKLTFVAWDCITGLDCKTLSEKLVQLDHLGFLFTPFIPIPADMMTNTDHIRHAIMLLQAWAKEDSYPVDGIVFKFDNCEYYQSLGATEHHFRGGIAYKFYDEAYETQLRNIEWNMGRTGQLTPVAVFDPIDIDGSTVERCSLSNVSILKQKLGKPFVGQIIKVTKSNMIIPYLVDAQNEEGEWISEL